MFLFGKSPSLADLENPKVEQASEIYTSDGVLIGKYFRENRSPVPLSQMSPLLIKALVATEDVRFYEHSGIDLQAVLGGAFFVAARREARRLHHHPAAGQKPLQNPPRSKAGAAWATSRW